MLTQVAVNRETGEGRYADVLDVCEHLADRFGSASNALVQIARESPLFEEALKELNMKPKKPRPTAAEAPSA